MKILSCVFTAMLCVAPVSAYANTWFLLDSSEAQCELLPSGGLIDPNQTAIMLRRHNELPDIEIIRNSDGSINRVDLVTTQPGGNIGTISFFTSMNDCQIMLQEKISAGIIVNPNDLK